MLFVLVRVVFLFSSVPVTFSEDVFTTTPLSCDNESLQTPPQPLARRKNSHENSAHLIGLFDVHEGNRCHLLRPGGMEQVMMTIAVLENRLMKFEDNDTQIGKNSFLSWVPPRVKAVLAGAPFGGEGGSADISKCISHRR